MLSFNAAVEAARAGDAGKGFSVVAEEIKNLSDSTKKSALDISDQIELISKSMTNLIEGFGHMDSSIDDLQKKIEMISQAAQTQKNSMVQVIDLGKQNNQATELIREHAQSLKEVSNGLFHAVTPIGERSQNMLEISRELRSSLIQYKTGDEKRPQDVFRFCYINLWASFQSILN